jgi:hypothetical protein
MEGVVVFFAGPLGFVERLVHLRCVHTCNDIPVIVSNVQCKVMEDSLIRRQNLKARNAVD